MIEFLQIIIIIIFLAAKNAVLSTLFIKATRGGGLLGSYQKFAEWLLSKGYYKAETALNGCLTCFPFWLNVLFGIVDLIILYFVYITNCSLFIKLLYIFFIPQLIVFLGALFSFILIQKKIIDIDG